MLTMNMKDARASFDKLVNLAQRGETIIITRHGKQAVRVLPSIETQSSLPSLRQFRAGIAGCATPLSSAVVADRDEERY